MIHSSISYLDIVSDVSNSIYGINSILLESIDKKPHSSHWCILRSPPGSDLDIFRHSLHFSTTEVVSKNVKVRWSHVEKCRRQSRSCRKMSKTVCWLTDKPFQRCFSQQKPYSSHSCFRVTKQIFCQKCFKVTRGFMFNWNLNLNWT